MESEFDQQISSQSKKTNCTDMESVQKYTRPIRTNPAGKFLLGLFLICYYTTYTVCTSVISFVVWCLATAVGQPRWHHALNCSMSSACWTSMLWMLERWGGVEIVVSGDQPLPVRETAVVLANHQVYIDWLTIFSVANRRGALAMCKFFVKDSVKYIPGFGWSVWMLEWIFVKRNWASDQAAIERSFAKLRASNDPFWLIIYPEGTRRTEHNQKASQAYCVKNGLRTFDHVLYPRVKGTVASVKSLRGRVTALYDFTIGYEQRRTPSIWQLAAGECGHRFHIHVKRWPIDDLPKDDEGLGKFVVQRFVEKEALMDHFLKHNEFVEKTSSKLWNEPFPGHSKPLSTKKNQ